MDTPAEDPPPTSPPSVTITDSTSLAAQTKVRIETPGATVEVEANESLDTVSTVALRLFREAGGWPKEDNRSAGFIQTERRDTVTTETYPIVDRIAEGSGPLHS